MTPGGQESAPPGPAPARPLAGSLRGRRRWLAGGAIALVLALVAAFAGPRILSWLRPAAPTGLLSASGRIEGRITTLTPKTGAWVVALQVDEGQAVRQGQLLATLDDLAQRERVRAAEEQVNALARKLVAANSQLGMIERQTTLQTEQAAAALRETEARLRRARAGLRQAERDAQRVAVLVAKELIAPQEGEHARLQVEVEENGVKEAEEALVSSEKQLALARVGLQQIEIVRAERDALARQRAQAEAQLAEQRSHVADFAVRSPIDGRVLTRTVERGERVEAGTPLFTLIDLDRLYVKIYVPEPSIGKVALGQEARVSVDAYPGRAFPARVSRVSQEAEFTPKNVETKEERVKLVFAVEVALGENPGGVLKPGMPADAVIRWQPDAPWR
ncbi:MAG TPA: efflux RND transporter periplasmic adaptor subunit [Methylomirabilota bacterium]|nr:efflux RND transporter periplasmic adaptor subunit [Methylomirabilota bacterium]